MPRYECYRCKYITNFKFNIKKHLNRLIICKAKYNDIDINECKECILKGISYEEYITEINNNSNNNNNDYNYNCKYCNKLYKYSQSLYRHLKTCKVKNGELTILKEELENKDNELENIKNEFENMKEELNEKDEELKNIKRELENIKFENNNKTIEDNNGIVYLIQPAELINTNCYKVGCSKSQTDKRLRSYNKGYKLLFISQCQNPFKIEELIKTEFNNNFELISGKEYYKGDEKKMYNIFMKILNEYNI